MRRDKKMTHGLLFVDKENPVKINYLIMIWAVKIVVQNKKDGKGKDLNFPAKKNLPTKIWPKILLSGHFLRLYELVFLENPSHEMARFHKGLSEFQPK